MAYTQEQLTALEAAIATGTTRVEMAGRLVQYASLTEMLRLRDLLRAELGLAPPSAAKGKAWQPATSHGL